MEFQSMKIANAVIRKATTDDAAEIANIHLNSWREAYHNILPREYLDQLPLAFKSRMNMWNKISLDNQQALFVVEAESGIVGFSVVGPARDSQMKKSYGEVSAIYLLKKFQGQGIGTMLLKVGMWQLIDWEVRKAYCWVLEKNPAIKFYEKSGAVFNDMVKNEEIGGMKVKELCYEWKSLEHFKL